jgi:hypothetical protein
VSTVPTSGSPVASQDPHERPGVHPDPPEDLAHRQLPLEGMRGPWCRIHRDHRGPLFFGRKIENRFDAPDGGYGVLYAGDDEHCAFIETVGWHTGENVVGEKDLEKRKLARVRPTRPLQLVDLTGRGLARVGADGRLLTGEHSVARRWSAAFRDHPSRPDGIYYRARHDPSRCSVALYEHVAEELEVEDAGGLMALQNRTMLSNILDEYGFGLEP